MAKKKNTKEENFDLACELVEEGLSLRKACKQLGVSPPTMYRVIEEDTTQKRQQQYARACAQRAELMFEDMIHIADDSKRDTQIVDIEGIEIETINKEHIQRSKLRVDTRKWALSKMNPKKYGDKLDIDGKLNIKTIKVITEDEEDELDANDDLF